MSLSELAKEMKVSIGYLSEIESGKKNPSLDIIRKYATVFHTTESAILFFSENIQIDSKTKTALRNNILKFLEALDHLKKSK